MIRTDDSRAGAKDPVSEKDGKTSYERLAVGQETIYRWQPLENVSAISHSKQAKRDRSKLERLREGIWLGMFLRTNKALIGALGGVVKARTIRTLPEDEKWEWRQYFGC